jgi:tRNA(Arg) A34 adenosine deaminase TadA
MDSAGHAGMDAALAQARQALLAGETPIGAALWRNGALVTGHNALIAELDPTAHAEMRVLREAARAWRSLDLSGSRLFVTVEPCAMCRTACHYAGITEIFFGASLADLHTFTGNEFLPVTAASDALELSGGHRRDECLDLLRAWSARRAS